jgi:leader peptidase (prepilin peptidase)/N-methyltransferase
MNIEGFAEVALVGLLGLCLGSFVATAALRAARGSAYLTGRSRCDACGTELGYLATLPVISFVSRRGACSACGRAIDRSHLVGELSGAALLMTSFALLDPLRATLVSGLGLSLIAAAINDAKTMRLPDVLTLVAATLGALLAALRSPEALVIGVGAAALTALILLGARSAYSARGGSPGLGLGDVKLASALALWLGFATPWALTLAAVLGLLFVFARGAWRRRFAFGPALVAGGLLVGLAEEALRWPPLA